MRRDLHLFGAVVTGLGSIIGTGVFVSLAIGAEAAGAWVLPAIIVAGGLALANGLSSAQLAARHPVSGGTYEYARRELTPALGFAAGWMFLAAKSASAATAALGFASYLGHAAGWSVVNVGVALVAVVVVTAVILAGVRRTARVNAVLVTISLGALATFIIAGWRQAWAGASVHVVEALQTSGSDAWRPALEATALMFVAYTGYGRIATMGEEVAAPERTIPRAIMVTMAVTATAYVLTAFVAIGAAGASSFGSTVAGSGEAAPLERIAALVSGSTVALIVSIGAIVAMLGVLLNLLLGLSRVWLAMGRGGDMPKRLEKVDAMSGAPVAAVVVAAITVGALTMIGDVRTTWSFSAFTVLIYYALTNASALRLSKDARRYPRWIAWLGVAGCLGLAFTVTPAVWMAGCGLLAAGFVWRAVWRGATDRAARAG